MNLTTKMNTLTLSFIIMGLVLMIIENQVFRIIGLFIFISGLTAIIKKGWRKK